MIVKFDVYKKNKFVKALYSEIDEDEDATTYMNFILACFMEFRTHCHLNDHDPNVFYFENWMRKYKGVEFITSFTVNTVRVDI